ncbi:protein root UVB sensitive [Trifolium repens]|nr:protein root UVB sensitive [Trifolium repens]
MVKWPVIDHQCRIGANVKAMFTAIGVGYSSSLPSAAALNWVLKDGLGRLSRCIYTASLASAFDTNLKKEASFPKLFLLLATIANIAKQISLGCYLATQQDLY